MRKRLPKVAESKFQELDGVRYVREAVEDRVEGLGWIFRSKNKTDIGIDAEIEMVTDHQEGTGKLLSVQIKCGPSYLKERSGTGYVFRGEEEHLNYWLDHSLPVLLVIVDPAQAKCHWVEVTAGAVERTGKGWKIEVPFRNVLQRAQRSQLTWVAQRDNLLTLANLNIVRWLYAKFYQRIYVLDIFEVPRDYHWWSELACLDEDKMIGVHAILDRYGSFDPDEVREALGHIETNRHYVPDIELFLCLISSSRRALKIPEALAALISEYSGVTTFRFLFEDDMIREVLADGALVDGFSLGEAMTFGRTIEDA